VLVMILICKNISVIGMRSLDEGTCRNEIKKS
jgi:hypothetical protein